MANENQDWRKYEAHIYERLRAAGGPGSVVEFDKKLPGRFSGVDRQVDVWVKGRYSEDVESDVTAAVDCKYYTRNVNVKGVETFIGLVDDVGTDLGFLFTTEGYSPAAEARAKNGSRGIRLRTVPFIVIADIDEFSPVSISGLVEPYYEGAYYDNEPQGDVGATVRFHFARDTGYAFNPDQELDWEIDDLASGEDDALSWGDDVSRAVIARIVLRHYLGAEPEDEVVEAFVQEIASGWEDGYPWVLERGDIKGQTGY